MRLSKAWEKKHVDMAFPPPDAHWREYRLDAISFQFVKSILEPDDPFFISQ